MTTSYWLLCCSRMMKCSVMNKREYAPDWSDVIRPAILKRDGYKCRHCGIPHRARVYRQSSGQYYIVDEFTEQWALSQGKKVFTVYLQVAHVDQDKTNNDPANLLSLCPRHHAKLDRDFKLVKRRNFVKLIQDKEPSTKVLPSQRKNDLELKVRSRIRELTGVKISLNEVREVISIITEYGTTAEI